MNTLWYVDTPGVLRLGDTKHPHHDLLLPFLDWAKEEGLVLRIHPNHDGGGMESWWEITVKSAT